MSDDILYTESIAIRIESKSTGQPWSWSYSNCQSQTFWETLRLLLSPYSIYHKIWFQLTKIWFQLNKMFPQSSKFYLIKKKWFKDVLMFFCLVPFSIMEFLELHLHYKHLYLDFYNHHYSVHGGGGLFFLNTSGHRYEISIFVMI